MALRHQEQFPNARAFSGFLPRAGRDQAQARGGRIISEGSQFRIENLILRDKKNSPGRNVMALALYHNDMSSCAQKVRLVLAEKGLEWENRHLDLRAGEHQKDWYIKLNPRAGVPLLIDGDCVVRESNLINNSPHGPFPTPPHSPADPFGRARMRLWTK